MAARLGSCTECGCLVCVASWRNGAVVEVFVRDWYDEEREGVERILGTRCVLRQGFGWRIGGRHLCPPIDPALLSKDLDDAE